MNFQEELQKMDMTKEQYESCLSDIQDKLNGLLDIEWDEIRQKYNMPISSVTLRKANGTIFGGFAVAEYMKRKQSDLPATYTEQMEKIRREKQKLMDERTALKKSSRENARGEENLKILKEIISENGKEIFNYSPITVQDYGNDLIVCLSDMHIGMDAKTQFGEYNSEIAKERLIDYMVEILKIQKTHKSQNVYVLCLGDQLNGSIHVTTRLENRENVVQQVQTASEYISAFIYELSKHFENVYVTDVPGNHSRIGLKDEVLRNERLDDLIIWYAQAKLEHIGNIFFVNEKYDDTIASISIRGNEYLVCHGDYDAFSESGLNKLCMFIGHIPTGIFMGHLHHCSFDEINDVKLIRSGSFAGTCDDYTVSKRLYSKPSQMVCVANNDGIQAMYPIKLK